MIATDEADTFFFANGHDNNDDGNAIDVIVGFSDEDTIKIRTDGKQFQGEGFDVNRGVIGEVTTDNIDDFADFLNDRDGANEAYYNEDTNSSVLVYDHNSNGTGYITIVLWDSDNLIA